jgi:hypothetical protein
MTTFDLTGDWTGHYEQNRGRHGISMRIVQRGQSFVGAMRDADTMLSSRERLHAVGDDGKRPDEINEVEVLSTLPEHSTIEGEVEGRVVTFVKSYRGTSTTSVWGAGGAKADFEAPGHQVNYRGTLDARGDEFAGHWTIEGADDGPKLRDRFLLRRTRATTTP